MNVYLEDAFRRVAKALMYRAYIFPFGIKISQENLPNATAVNLETEYPALILAANEKRLRCPYQYCLERVTPVRVSKASNALRCFSHVPRADGPLCLYRTESTSDGEDRIPHGERYRHNIRKIIENVLSFELRRKLSQRTSVIITTSEYTDREPRIQIDLPGRVLIIKALAPGADRIWGEGFRGELDGTQVLFFVASVDMEDLKPQINKRFLSIRPALAVYYSDSELQDHTYKVISRIVPSRGPEASGDPMNTLDLIHVNYEKLFGFSRASEFLFINSEHREAVEYVEKILDRENHLSHVRKLLQLIAKRLLVNGALIHQSVFQQSQQEARQFFKASVVFPSAEQLVTFDEFRALIADAPVKEMLKQQPLVWSHYWRFYAEGLDAMGLRIKELDQKKSDLLQQLEEERSKWKLEKKKIDDQVQAETDKRRDMERDLNALTQKMNGESARRLELERDLNTLTEKLNGESDRRQELERDLSALREKLNGESDRRQELERDLSALTEKLRADSDMRQGLKRDLDTMEDEVKSLKSELEATEASQQAERQSWERKESENSGQLLAATEALKAEKDRKEELKQKLEKLQQNWAGKFVMWGLGLSE